MKAITPRKLSISGTNNRLTINFNKFNNINENPQSPRKVFSYYSNEVKPNFRNKLVSIRNNVDRTSDNKYLNFPHLDFGSRQSFRNMKNQNTIKKVMMLENFQKENLERDALKKLFDKRLIIKNLVYENFYSLILN